MKYLSFDCANVSLGVVCVLCDDLTWVYEAVSRARSVIDIINHMKEPTCDKSAVVRMLEEAIDNLILWVNCRFVISYANVIDVLGGRKVADCDAPTRVSALKKVLTDLDGVGLEYDAVVVENQMSPNEKSRGVYYCILYHYSERGIPVYSINPCRKNTIIDELYVDKPWHLSHTDAIIAASSSWAANKKHSKENFANILRDMGRADLIKTLGKRLPDAADSYYGAIAHYLKN